MTLDESLDLSKVLSEVDADHYVQQLAALLGIDHSDFKRGEGPDGCSSQKTLG